MDTGRIPWAGALLGQSVVTGAGSNTGAMRLSITRVSARTQIVTPALKLSGAKITMGANTSAAARRKARGVQSGRLNMAETAWPRTSSMVRLA